MPSGYDGPKRYIGQTDLHLSSQGKTEADILGKWFAENTNVNKIYSSPLLRAKETAQIIRKHCNCDNELIFEDNIKEIHVGEWEHRLIQDVIEHDYKEYEARGREIYDREFPKGESFRQVGDCFAITIDKILKEKQLKEEILVVSHGVRLMHISQRLV